MKKIYQITDDKERLKFMNYRFFQANGYNEINLKELGYTLVAKTDLEEMEIIFRESNTGNVNGCITLIAEGMHSLSVSDIIIDQDEQSWFCDSIGFTKVKTL